MRTFCFVLGLVFLTGTLWGQQISDRRLLRQIKKIPSLSNAYIGVHVESLEKDIALAGIHEIQYFTPASNTKLLTFLGAIQTFPKLPVLEYAYDNDSIAHFKSTAYPLLLHPFYSDSL
ncbi:D-alanyl-D-alanine carboxypeptidase, partial [Flavobacteriaceae bacterium]|nr:D-alanyl-D-alanine carboxypeptidase [Flavobacteriaceae bacterium]